MSYETVSPFSPSTVVVIDLEPVSVEGLGGELYVGLDGSNKSIYSQNKSTCQVCDSPKSAVELFQFSGCGHSFCTECVKRVFKMNVSESKVDIQCLKCNASITQEEIRYILDVDEYDKYLGFTLRQYLSRESGVQNCPAPDCPFACISTPITSPSSSLEDSDKIAQQNHFICLRDGCGYEQCIKCKRVWHHGQTCDEYARDNPSVPEGIDIGRKGGRYRSGNTKACPSCSIPIEKLQDGSCNQVTCTVCRTRFCWLCGQQVSEMHFIRSGHCGLLILMQNTELACTESRVHNSARWSQSSLSSCVCVCFTHSIWS